MALDLGGIGATAMGWLSTSVFWVIAIALIVVAIILGLVFRKNRKFDRPVLELYDLSNVIYDKEGRIDLDNSVGIFDFKLTKGGWFKNRFALGGLWDYGTEKIFRLKDMTPVYDVSHNDYRKINGKNGLVVVRNPNDSKFVIPISKFFISKDSRLALANIAPVDLRNAAINAIEQVDSEMQTKWQQLAPILTAAFLGIVLIFSILLITQYGKHMVDQSKDILKYASDAVRGINNAAAVTQGGSP
jgi:uncharacterized membrane protein (DUF485 family)